MSSAVEPWYVDTIRDLAGVATGWLLAVLSSAITDRRKDRRRVDGMRRAVSGELGEVAYRMLIVSYMVQIRFVGLHREFLDWLVPQLEKYAGPNLRDELVTRLQTLRNRSNEELTEIAEHQRRTESPTLFEPQLGSGYVSSVIAQAHDFEPAYAVRLFDIVRHMQDYNDLREEQFYYHRLTFSSDLTPENHRGVVTNYELALRKVGQAARRIVDRIEQLDATFPPPGR